MHGLSSGNVSKKTIPKSAPKFKPKVCSLVPNIKMGVGALV